MGILDLLSPILKIAGKALGIGDKVKEVADAISGAPPEVRAQIARDLQEHERALKALSIEELKTVMSETQLMIASPDKYVSRARPTGLYTAYIISLGLAAALAFGTQIDAAAILTLCAPMYGAQGYYMHLRTKEKMNGGTGD